MKTLYWILLVVRMDAATNKLEYTSTSKDTYVCAIIDLKEVAHFAYEIDLKAFWLHHQSAEAGDKNMPKIEKNGS